MNHEIKHGNTGNNHAARLPETSTAVVQIRCTEAEKAKWLAKAKFRKQSLSELIRELLYNA